MNKIDWKAILYGTGLAFGFLIFVFVLYVLWQNLMGYLDEPTGAQPCDSSSVESRCYNIASSNCPTIWDRYEKDCKAQVQASLGPDRVTALIGPTVKACVYRRIDQTLHSARKLVPEDPVCIEHFKKMDAPRAE